MPEPRRALEQHLATVLRRVKSLERTVARPGRTRIQDCDRTYFPAVLHTPLQPSDGYWVWHPMAEFDLDPGAWLVQAFMQFELYYDFLPDELGYHKMSLGVFSTAPDDPTVTTVISVTKCPMAQAVDQGGTALSPRNAFDLLNLSRKISSDTGLHLTLSALLEVNGSSPTIDAGSPFWLGPGQLMATPL